MPRSNSRDAKVTIVEIARLAGVGVGTASRALSNAKDVAPHTRERVLRVAEDLNYVVSPEASRLARGVSGRVAVVVPHLSRWFFGEVVEGLVRELHRANLDVLLYHVADPDERHDFFTRLPARRKVDAVVVVGFQVDADEQAQLATMGVHIVAAGGQSATYPSVHIDDHTAARQAMDHLLFLGHQRIAMLEAYDPTQPSLPPTRSTAYSEALLERGLPVDPGLILAASWSGENGAALMAQVLSLAEPPTAVFAHSDEVALGALRTIRRSGLRPGIDISVIGIDGHPLAELTDLTTVRQDPASQGVIAGQMVLTLLGGGTITEPSVITPTELVVRASTGRPSHAVSSTGTAGTLNH